MKNVMLLKICITAAENKLDGRECDHTENN
jgi:hypothetical protein